MTNLSSLLLQYRSNRNLGVRAFADELGVSQSTVSRIERGLPLELETWKKIEAWLFMGSVMEGKE
jgi:transcriptional regulator with XRE-family HTH domain